MATATTVAATTPVLTAKPSTAVSLTAARISLLGTAAFVALLAALHFLKPEIEPSWRFISEYAIGDYGWLMAVAFFTWAIAHVALALALRPHLRTASGRIGLVFFLVGVAGLVLAGIFPTDPITTAPDAVTTAGRLHSLGGTLGIAGVVGTLLICWSLVRSPTWSAPRRSLLWATGLVLLGFLVSVGSLILLLSRSGGTFGPDVPVGWPNRFEVVTICAWLIVVARCADRLRDRTA